MAAYGLYWNSPWRILGAPILIWKRADYTTINLHQKLKLKWACGWNNWEPLPHFYWHFAYTVWTCMNKLTNISIGQPHSLLFSLSWVILLTFPDFFMTVKTETYIPGFPAFLGWLGILHWKGKVPKLFFKALWKQKLILGKQTFHFWLYLYKAFST